jgi:hypothetical protein
MAAISMRVPYEFVERLAARPADTAGPLTSESLAHSSSVTFQYASLRNFDQLAIRTVEAA